MKLVVATLLTALVLLQYRLWISDEGMREVWHLRQAVENQGAENAILAERNAQMKAEVADLKLGLTRGRGTRPQRSRHDRRQRNLLPGGRREPHRPGRRTFRARLDAGPEHALTRRWPSASGS